MPEASSKGPTMLGPPQRGQGAADSPLEPQVQAHCCKARLLLVMQLRVRASLLLQPASTAKRTRSLCWLQPSSPTPDLRKGRLKSWGKISLTSSWVQKRAACHTLSAPPHRTATALGCAGPALSVWLVPLLIKACS